MQAVAFSKENAVNTHDMTGSADDMAGNDQVEAGEFAGSREQDTRGNSKQVMAGQNSGMATRKPSLKTPKTPSDMALTSAERA